MKYGYYPGCSLERNARAYHQSTVAVAQRLGLTLEEIEDWNCCGATEMMSLEALPAYSLVARNLAIAQSQFPAGTDLIAPCSACFLNLRKTAYHLRTSKRLADQVNDALSAGGLHYKPNGMVVRHLLEVFVEDVGIDRIQESVTNPLRGLRLAPYYGCLIVRPHLDRPLDDPEYPTSLDRLLSALAAEVVDYPLKAACCGGHMTQISEDTALELIHRLLRNAHEHDAHAIVTLCPMCQLNLDGYQHAINKRFGTHYRIPILYFTQVLGLALGLEKETLGFGQELTDARPALARIKTDPKEPVRRAPAAIDVETVSTPPKATPAGGPKSPPAPRAHLEVPPVDQTKGSPS